MNYPMNQISDHLIFSPLFSRKAGGSGDFGFRLGDLQRQNRDLDGGQDDDGAMAAMDDEFSSVLFGEIWVYNRRTKKWIYWGFGLALTIKTYGYMGCLD